jgi:hypothetical protein
MSDDDLPPPTRPPEHGPPGPGAPEVDSASDDAQDEAVGAALAVADLDEHTRRRLLRRSMDAYDAAEEDEPAATGRRGRFAAALSVAAVIVIGAVVGAVLVNQPDDPHTAAPATTATSGSEAKAAAPAPAAASDSGAASAEVPVADLGDLGAVADADALRAAIDARLEAGTATRPPALPCLPLSNRNAGIYGLVVITAAGQANLAGAPVVVMLGPTAAGQNVAVVLNAERGCELVQLVNL